MPSHPDRVRRNYEKGKDSIYFRNIPIHICNKIDRNYPIHLHDFKKNPYCPFCGEKVEIPNA